MNDDLAMFWQSAYWWTQNLFRNFLPHVFEKKNWSQKVYIFNFTMHSLIFLEPIAKDNISALLRVALFKKKKKSMTFMLLQTETWVDETDVPQWSRVISHFTRAQHWLNEWRRSILRPIPLVQAGWEVSNASTNW